MKLKGVCLRHVASAITVKVTPLGLASLKSY